MRNFLRAVLASAIVVAAAATARADQTDPRLKDLFAQLPNVDAETAAPIEAQIWHIWLESGHADIDAMVAEGVLHMNDGENDSALSVFDKVVAAAPDYAEGWNKRATVLYLLGRFADSVRDIDRVLALEPRHFGALSGLGLCRVQLHDDRAALAAFQRAAAIDPHLSGVQANIEALKKQIEQEHI